VKEEASGITKVYLLVTAKMNLDERHWTRGLYSSNCYPSVTQ